MKLVEPSTWLVCSSAFSVPVCTLTSSGTTAWTFDFSSDGETPSCACR